MDQKTETSAIEKAFDSYTQERKDIAILLINQHVCIRRAERFCFEAVADTFAKVADKIRQRVDTYTAAFPSLLEIPSKDHPYDPEKDSVLRRVRRLFGE